jgi:hypothetical protein
MFAGFFGMLITLDDALEEVIDEIPPPPPQNQRLETRFFVSDVREACCPRCRPIRRSHVAYRAGRIPYAPRSRARLLGEWSLVRVICTPLPQKGEEASQAAP